MMAEASGENFDSFRIPVESVNPIVVSYQMAPWGGGPGRTDYSKDKYCDSNLFKRKLESLAGYIPQIEDPLRSDPASEYSKLSDEELQRLAFTNHIRAHADGARTIDRDLIIRKLMEKNKSAAPTHQLINYGTISGSPVQQGTSYSTITAQYNVSDIREIIERIKSAIPQLDLTAEVKSQLELDIQTIEPQLASNRPKGVIITECLCSVRAILEGAVGSAIASGLVFEIDKIIKAFGH